jgi:Rieske Fe-S protein
MCPCHGGAYYENGEHAAGPPPRGLYTYEYQVVGTKLEIKGGILPNLGNTGNPTEKKS